MRTLPFIIILFFMTISFSCKKKDDTFIPLVPVNLYLYVTDPEYFNLNVVGGWAYIEGGSRGILIYHQTQDEYIAYDRNCTYQPSNSCAQISVDATNIMAEDTCCGSVFLLTDGSVANGPASRPLKMYQTSFDGTALHITN